MKCTLVLQSFGLEHEYKRAIFCILSHFCQKSPAEQVILFTDKPIYFEPYLVGIPVQYILLTDEKIRTMRGPIDFLHRMKIALIEEAFQITSGNLLYVDSDTFFIATLDKVMAQVSHDVAFMHEREYAFDFLKDMPLPAGVPFRAFYELINSREFKLPGNSALRVQTTQASWNAGAMVFHNNHKNLLPAVYGLTDQFYPPTMNHASEQYAFSIILQNHTQLQSLNSEIYHYWYRVKKKIMDKLLDNTFTPEWFSLPQEKRQSKIKQLIKSLPGFLANHPMSLRDNAIQAFHDNDFKKGYRFVCHAIIKDPIGSFQFIKDVMYHTKRLMKGKTS